MDGLEVFHGGVLNGAELALEPGVVHRNVGTAESCDRVVDEIADLVFLRHIGPNELCLGAERSQLGGKFLPLVVVAAGHDHVGAFVGEGHGGGAADAGEGAGYENNLLSHLFPSAMRNSADLTVAFKTNAPTIDVAVG
jgi:hypothetical protein